VHTYAVRELELLVHNTMHVMCRCLIKLGCH
jgi:hypothetical protein